MIILLDRLKEVAYSVLPITFIVLILSVTLVPIEQAALIRFLIAAAVIILGLAIFLMGVEFAIDPLGKHIGALLVRSANLWVLIVTGLVLGFLISIAEPDLHVLAEQVDWVTGGQISKGLVLVVVSIGVAVLITLGLLRIVFQIPLSWFLTASYLVVLLFAVFNSPEFLAISFDACGATTGALTVPFILALAIGVSELNKDHVKAEEDSFGLIGITSVGAILGVLVMGVMTSATGDISGNVQADTVAAAGVLAPFLHFIPQKALEVSYVLLPLTFIFLVLQLTVLHLPRDDFRKMIEGLSYAYVGLTMFLVAVNAGFIHVGRVVGFTLTSNMHWSFVVFVGVLLGLVTVLAEPAVHVLTRQIEDVTAGSIKRRFVWVFLCLSIGVAVGLSVLRTVVPGIQLWHYLLPAYIIAIAMTYYAPPLFIGIAFDSGGVASGPMTATFILAFAQGVAEATEGAEVLKEGFGVIAMVATAPLIALQILGFVYTRITRVSLRAA